MTNSSNQLEAKKFEIINKVWSKFWLNKLIWFKFDKLKSNQINI